MNFSGKYIVLKGDLPLDDRIVKCINHENNIITIRRLNSFSSEQIYIIEIEGYLTFNEISDLMIGEYVSYCDEYYMNEFSDHIPIIKTGVIVSIEYDFKNIKYGIKTDDNNIIYKSHNNLIYDKKPALSINSYVSVMNNIFPKNFIDGKINIEITTNNCINVYI